MNGLYYFKSIIITVLIAFSPFLSVQAQDCTNDTIAPTLYCNPWLYAALDYPSNTRAITPEMIVYTSSDNCGIAAYKMAFNLSDEPPFTIPSADSLIFDCCNAGMNEIIIWAIDSTGNSTSCNSTLFFGDNFGFCDTFPINCTPKTISGQLFFDDNENCTNDNEEGVSDVTLSLIRLSDGAVQLITTTDSIGQYQFDIPYHDGSDYEISIVDQNLQSQTYGCGTNVVVSIPLNTNSVVQDLPILFNRLISHTIIDLNLDCTIDSTDIPILSTIEIIRLSDSTSYISGHNESINEFRFPYGDSNSYLIRPIHVNVLEGADFLPGILNCLSDSTISFVSSSQTIEVTFPFQLHRLTGYVYYDENANCIFDSTEVGIAGVHVWGNQFYSNGRQGSSILTDSTGYYSIGLLSGDTSFWEISIANMPTTALSCGSFANVYFQGDSLFTGHDFGTQLVPDCPFLIAGIGANSIERCFNNTIYSNNCNYGDTLVTDVYLEIQFDTFLQVNSSTYPWIAVDSNRYTFFLDTLMPGECVNFELDVTTSCDAILGQTHCIEAILTPQPNCLMPDSTWSGAIIQTAAECESDSVKLSITNIGDGDMNAPLDFTVVEDLVMFMEGNFELESGDTHIKRVPANGSTWRIEAMQAPGYPEWLFPASWIEGCGGINNVGIITQFPINSTPANIAVSCMSNIGSYDPNDKQSFPKGYGPEHYIRPNQPIDYLIRFQNTGTAPARNVIIKDTISPHLIWGGIRLGTSSHEYEYKVSQDGVIEFIFKDIYLPDSTSNEPASHGFVKFQIDQLPDLANGTLIENSAAIYFDFNEPIITNNTQLKVMDHFIEQINNTVQVATPKIQLLLYPNPLNQAAILEVRGIDIQDGHFGLYNSFGQLVQQQSFKGQEVQILNNGLNPGMYVYKIYDGSNFVGSGQVIEH